MKLDPILQQFIEETRALTTHINEFSNHWYNIVDHSPPVDQIPTKQKTQLVQAVTMFEEACRNILEKP